MSNFWKVDSKLAIAQKSVSVPSENGLAYTENGKIVIKVEPSVEYFLPSESYVQFRLKLRLGGAARTRLQLSDRTGGHSIINHVRVLSGTGILLEEIQNYNVLAYLMYSYDTNDTKRRKRSLTERTTMFNPACASTHGAEQRDNNSCVDNPYFANGKDLGFVYVKVCLPLVASGLFRNPKIFPTMLTQGLRLEITLEEASRCVQRLCTVAPTFLDRDPTKAASGTEWLPRLETVGDAGLGKGWKKTAAFTITAATKATTCVVTISHPSPSPIGTIPSGTRILITLIPAAQPIAGILNGNQWYVKPTGSANEFELYGAYDAATGNFSQPADTSAVAPLAAPYEGIFHIENFVQQQVFYIDKDQNNITSVNNCPFVVGEKLSLANVSGALLNNNLDLGTISDIALGTGDHAGYVKITVGTLVFPDAALVDFTTDSVFYSTSFKDAAFKPGYDVDQVELVMQQVIMPKGYTGSMMKSMKDKGMMRYDFVSFMNYKHSMVSSDTEATIQLPLQNSRAKAVLMLPLDSSSLSAQQRIEDDDASAFRGILDQIKEYRFNVDQKLNPDRPVPLGLLTSGSIEQQYLIELEKSLAQSSIQPTSFRHFNQNFCLGRALALQGGSMDTRGKNIDVQISYADTAAKNKLWHMWAAHIKSIIVKQNDVSVQV
jgi:hypothetical protein